MGERGLDAGATPFFGGGERRFYRGRTPLSSIEKEVFVEERGLEIMSIRLSIFP